MLSRMNNVIYGKRITIRGIVQGVGFRPFIYSLALKNLLNGWVRNTSAGVEIEVAGDSQHLSDFIQEIREKPPALSKIDQIIIIDTRKTDYAQFEILVSQTDNDQFLPISPDVSICPDCLRELFDPKDRRFRYPFINCTNCGPRFTIIRDIPYDRPNTTMSSFQMCEKCTKEYEDPLERRFHAQPIACPTCGPQVWFAAQGKTLAKGEEAIQISRQWLTEGRILAIKGLGGFHLSCDASQKSSVNELRRRKLRSDKPFAVMVFDEKTAKKYCLLSNQEIQVLTSKEKPIVLSQRSSDSKIVKEVAPNLNTLGVMLPYTPLHYLLLEPAPNFPRALVMTSGNLSEEPIAFSNTQALENLSAMADGFLFHDREIHTRLDDSVIQVKNRQIYSIRRSRGFAPNPMVLSDPIPELLATGAGLKNTFCLTRENYAFVSHHIGDLENLETLTAFETSIRQYEQLFRIHPEAIACDLHPEYLSTRYAEIRTQDEKLPLLRIQHHHAHLASCLAENHWSSKEPVIGICFDGTGYGTDGAIWGGEFLLGGYGGFERKYHLKYIPLPGGDQATHNPSRIALAHLWAEGIGWDDDLPTLSQYTQTNLEILRNQLNKNINCPLTSSMGRFFDSAASLIGIRQTVNYEAQAAIELEALADPTEKGSYQFIIEDGIINPSLLWKSIITDLRGHIPASILSSRFQNSIVHLVITICQQIRSETGKKTTALSGGVWQNQYLLQRTVQKLEENGFVVLQHSQFPTNDGGISLGQAMILAHSINK
jgi:hydrogenase maturation protein HypF